MHKSNELLTSSFSPLTVGWQPMQIQARGGTRDAGTNTELRISSRPRTSATKHHKTSVTTHSRKSELSNAFSSIDISSSTKLQTPSNLCEVFSQSLTSIDRPRIIKRTESAAKPQQPIQRAASRLYRSTTITGVPTAMCVGPEFIVRASQPIVHLSLSSNVAEKKEVIVTLLNGQRINITCDPLTTTAGQIFQLIVKSEKYVHEHNFMLGISVLVGGDFIFLPDDYKIRKVSPEGWCNKSNGKTKMYKNKKAFNQHLNFVLFLRIKFFLPTEVGRRDCTEPLRNRIYLQLRRSIVEGQITSTLHQLIQLSGFALHIEFGDYSNREHGLRDYFLLEHYLPEVSCGQHVVEIKKIMRKAHEVRCGMNKEKAIDCFINLAQTFKDYGAHFYSAVWITPDGFFRNVWISISPKGIILYSRNTCIPALPNETYSSNFTHRVLLQSLAWQHIHSLHFNKKALYILLHNKNGLGKSNIKFKLKMGDNKSYFTFWLASLHHRFYVKFNAERKLIDHLSKQNYDPVSSETEMSINNKERQELNDVDAYGECSNYQDSYNMAVRGSYHLQRLNTGMLKLDLPDRRLEEFQNEENEKPSENKEKIEHEFKNKICIPVTDSLSSSESCSLPRRHGVKMGTKVFTAPHNKQSVDTTQLARRSTLCNPTQREIFCTERLVQSDIEVTSDRSDSDDIQSLSQRTPTCQINGMKLLPSRNYQCMNQNDISSYHLPRAFAIESPRVYSENINVYNPTTEDTYINNSLQEKFELLGCVQGERRYVTTILDREGTLGMQVAEGSDGNIYIKSITPNGPAWKTRKLIPGDQIISVDGQTLLNLPYQKSLSILQAAPKRVELIVLQNVSETLSDVSLGRYLEMSNFNSGNSSYDCKSGFSRRSISCISDVDKFSQNSIVTRTGGSNHADNKQLNVEDLGAIHALIKLTRDNVRDKIDDLSKLNAWNSIMLQKCISGNVVYDESGTSHDTMPTAHSGTLQTDTISNDSGIGKLCSSYNRSNKVGVQAGGAKRRPLSLHIPSDIKIEDHDLNSSYIVKNSFKAHSYENIEISKSIESLNEKKVQANTNYGKERDLRAVALPYNHGYRRKWVGPVRYPVTPCKISLKSDVKYKDSKIVQKRFLYCENNDGGQVFL